MATLQKIRSKGPLLVIVIGLALFAFIAGDAWKVFQPHQRNQDVGEVNGKSLSAQEYQQMLDEYADIVKFTSGTSAIPDEQFSQLKDEVWRTYVNSELINAEAEKIGLTVPDEEIEAIINEGSNPILQQTPFRNPQTGAFDKDVLKKFLADYATMDMTQMPAQYAEYYQMMEHYWNFIERNLRQNRLMEKYQTLLAQSIISNPVEAQASFDERTNQYDLLLAAVPYSSVADSTVTIAKSDLQTLYNKKKEQFKQNVETRNIKYIDVQVTPSDEDRNAVLEEVTGYTNQLENATEYVSFVRTTGSAFPYADVFYSKDAYPSDVVSRMDSVSLGEVYGPYYNQSDDSYNAFKILAEKTLPDSVQFRQIQVYTDNIEKTRTLADSIYDAIKGGADFAALAKQYNNANGEANWLTSAQYENAALDADNTKYINTICNLGIKETANLPLGQSNVIIQVLDRKAMEGKYKVAVIKRPVEFSKETYNQAYNKFSQFVAANQTLEELEANAEENGYRLLERRDFYSSEHGIGGVRNTGEALRWVFAAKPGEVSPLYDCGEENDRLLVVALEGINKKGYRTLEAVESLLRIEAIKDKKAEIIMAGINAKNITTFDQCNTIDNVVTDSVKHVTFSAPTFVSKTRGSEPLLGAYASVTESSQLTAPIKGNSGVYMLQVYNKGKLNETFNEETEETRIKNNTMRTISRFINDLYQKANVVDSRYLFF